MAKLRKDVTIVQGKYSRYNWDQWLDGQTWELVKGEDFTVEPATLRVALYNACKQRGLKADSCILPSGNMLVRAESR